MPDLPSYDDLPVRPGLPPGSSWGIWGEGDVFGCLNLLTPDRVMAGIGAVRRGRVFPLNLELELPGPPLFGRAAMRHEVKTLGGPFHDDELHGLNTQSSSQWDGFRHVGHPGYGFYDGVADEDHGVHHWARRGIAGRAVLADVARWRESQGRPIDAAGSDPIDPEDLHGTLAAAGVDVEAGDILLIRTGWLSWYRGLDQPAREALAVGRMKAPGLRPGTATARCLWDLHIAAVAADNPALEVWPPQLGIDDPARMHEGFVHFSLLPLLGMPIGELWDLDGLAADCAADGVYACLLTSAPLNVEQGVGTPPNALAIK
jgi:hypothetical protein